MIRSSLASGSSPLRALSRPSYLSASTSSIIFNAPFAQRAYNPRPSSSSRPPANSRSRLAPQSSDGDLDFLLPPPEALAPLRSYDDSPASRRPSKRDLRQQERKKAEAGSVVHTPATLRALADEYGGRLRNDQIPRSVVVCAVVPPESKPSRPILYGDLYDSKDMQERLGSCDLELVSVGKVTTTDDLADLKTSQVSIVRLVEKPDPNAEKEAASKDKTKVVQAQKSLGRISGLRNDGIAQELLISWVSSSNDMDHKANQARQYLIQAHRVKLVFQPKRKGGKRDPIPPLPIQHEMLEAVAQKLDDVAARSEPDKFDKGKNAAYLYVTPSGPHLAWDLGAWAGVCADSLFALCLPPPVTSNLCQLSAQPLARTLLPRTQRPVRANSRRSGAGKRRGC